MSKQDGERKPERVPAATPEGPQKIARRKLLEMAAYTAPAVIGSLLIPQDAYAAQFSGCNPARCGPDKQCNPPTCNPRPAQFSPLSSPTGSPATGAADSPAQRNTRTRR